ncbi:hypothetical protein UFOVP412_46 [uncultured Caudovirales phage]|uniref:Uncharacterized protein n=1 Tax=uncultured Caudovirales phage TaxID=2100421 RepID=A0A6J5M7R1_9CAUD|nr:hypothetical protein UFOVP412_46 [uncultured Caudovirales phage]
MGTRIDYTLDNGWGKLNEPLVFDSPIKGFGAKMPFVVLEESGKLTLETGFAWDFGSGAIDTPSMVIASAAHDAFCVLTDMGVIPWECRKVSDAYFRELLKANGTGWARRWWCWLGVRAYSMTFARWNRPV